MLASALVHYVDVLTNLEQQAPSMYGHAQNSITKMQKEI
jgi:hypothetical protein